MDAPEIDDRWAVPDAEWIDVGGDYVFVCRAGDGHERWFRLRADLAESLSDQLFDVLPLPWTGLLAAFQVGVGPWGNEPWIAPDFHDAIRQLAAPSDAQLVAHGGPRLVAARRDLLAFLRRRLLAGDTLIVDDGSGQVNRFPDAEAGWTETGRPIDATLLVLYRSGPDHVGEVGLDHVEVADGALEALAPHVADPGTASVLRDFLADEQREHRRIPQVGAMIAAMRRADHVDAGVFGFVSEAARRGWPVVVQSAGRFPLGQPPE